MTNDEYLNALIDAGGRARGRRHRDTAGRQRTRVRQVTPSAGSG